jgi:hypothetical protein
MADPINHWLRKPVVVSKAPPPPRTVGGGSYIPRGPKPTEVLGDLPPYYPASLNAETHLIVCRAVKKFPTQPQVAALCKYIIDKLRPYFRKAILEEKLGRESAQSAMDALVHYILVHNCDSESRRYELKNEVRRSEEWLRLAKTIVRSRVSGSRLKPSSKRKPTIESRRMAEAKASIQRTWTNNPDASHKDILASADNSGIEVPWQDCQSWRQAWANHEGAVKTFLSRARPK